MSAVQKQRRIKFKLLNMDEETKGKLLAILDGKFSEPSGSSEDYSEDDEINLENDSDSSQSAKGCTKAFCTCGKEPQIKVL